MQPAVSMAANALGPLEQVWAPDGHILDLNLRLCIVDRWKTKQPCVAACIAGQRKTIPPWQSPLPATEPTNWIWIKAQRPALRPCNSTLPVPALSLLQWS
jgi:hypothetical protein